MKCWSQLPMTREEEGTFWITEAGNRTFGPVRCRGEADNSGAKAHGNVIEDPTKSYGDHPSGRYRIVKVLWHPDPVWTYGPCFMLLDPLDGEALLAKQQGRRGLAIHGGEPGVGNRLRATFGCLRLDNINAEQVGRLVDAAPDPVIYECLLVT